MILNVTFVVWNLSNSYNSGNVARIIYDMLTRESEQRTWLRISTVLSKLKDFSRSGIHIHCKSGNISETVQDRDFSTTDS